MTDPILEARQLQERARAEGVDVFELINRERTEENLEGYENPFLDENGEPFHDRPEED